MQLVFASNNKNKIKEIRQLLPKGFQLLSLEEIGCTDDIPETAITIEGNALLKAEYVSKTYQCNCFADDSGLEVTALNGEPGVYSARYAGESKDDNANMDKLLTNLKGNENREAQFKTVIALIMNGEKYTFSGIVKGNITNGKRGTQGFGYDPVFIPEGYDKTFAEMSMEEKSNISHRGIAVRKLIEFCREL